MRVRELVLLVVAGAAALKFDGAVWSLVAQDLLAETLRLAPADAGAQAKRGPGPLAPLTSPLGGGAKIARPHHIPSMKGQNNELEERLAKIRADMAGEGGAAAPWDEFGRPKQLSFKK